MAGEIGDGRDRRGGCMMRIAIESTDLLVTVDGRPCRLWRGRTEGGHPVDLYIHRIASASPAAQEELAAELAETMRPVELADIEAEGRRAEIGRN